MTHINEKSSRKSQLLDLPNLGPKSESMLKKAGIRSWQTLQDIGAVEAYLRVKKSGQAASLNLLYALEGALTHTHWTKIGNDRKHALILELNAQEDALDQQNPDSRIPS